MSACIAGNLHYLPADIDIVVGIPRSGLVAAGMIALLLNRPLADVDGFLAGRTLDDGSPDRIGKENLSPGTLRRVLVVDDSVGSGNTMQRIRNRLENAATAAEFTYCAVYGMKRSYPHVDLVLERCPWPRMFEWNLLHHDVLSRACVDIDGVLCRDPTDSENDGGRRYRKFLSEAAPLARPSQGIRYLVTSRLEKYRAETEAWLAKWQIGYGELVMLDLPDERARRRLGSHGSFKAEFYGRSEAILFVESDHKQARIIARNAGKPVLCYSTQEMHYPDTLAPNKLVQDGRYLKKYVYKKLMKLKNGTVDLLDFKTR